jgi:hypothetical protein
VTLDIEVREGCLCGVPSDGEGALLLPWGEGKSWCAAVTGTAKKWERHFWDRPRPRREGRYYLVPGYARAGVVLEFGVNHNQQAQSGDEDIRNPGVFAVAVSIRGEPKRRRWYGVIADVSDERLTLAPCKDVAQALAVAISYEAEPILPHLRDQIATMVQNIKGGALMELGVLADLLDDLSDPRGKRIREALRETVEGLFPECKPPEEKKANLKLKALGSSEVQPT